MLDANIIMLILNAQAHECFFIDPSWQQVIVISYMVISMKAILHSCLCLLRNELITLDRSTQQKNRIIYSLASFMFSQIKSLMAASATIRLRRSFSCLFIDSGCYQRLSF